MSNDRSTGKKINNCRVKARFDGGTTRTHTFMIRPNEFEINGSIHISKEDGIEPGKMVGELLADSKAIIEQIQVGEVRFSLTGGRGGRWCWMYAERPEMRAPDLFEKWEEKGDTDGEEVQL